jgi:hypothetical protein
MAATFSRDAVPEAGAPPLDTSGSLVREYALGSQALHIENFSDPTSALRSTARLASYATKVLL